MNPIKFKERRELLKSSKVERRVYVTPIKDANRGREKCRICKKDMLVAMGQEAYFHKQCRKLRHNKHGR